MLREPRRIRAVHLADLLVAAAGETLGPIVQISETPNYNTPMPMFRADAASAGAVPVASGQIGLMASVTVTYKLAD